MRSVLPKSVPFSYKDGDALDEMESHLKKISPVILGRGRAGLAIAKSFANLKLLHPEWPLADVQWLKRDLPLADQLRVFENPLLAIANPPGLHASSILEAHKAGCIGILCEKPACVSEHEIKALREVKTPTAVFHVYRQMWGPQTLRKKISENFFGEIISVEGRCWQSSTAARALQLRKGEGADIQSWKNDLRLSGAVDVYLDLATHWLDLASFLHGSSPTEIRGWRSYVNAETPHRDSHVQVMVNFPRGQRAFGSISKTVHGTGNDFEIHILGSLRSATWRFHEPDVLHIGEGRERTTWTRNTNDLGSQQPAFHATGWLEGYIEILRQMILKIENPKQQEKYPTLTEQLDLLQAMTQTKWQD